jgi:hypothetical protein
VQLGDGTRRYVTGPPAPYGRLAELSLSSKTANDCLSQPLIPVLTPFLADPVGARRLFLNGRSEGDRAVPVVGFHEVIDCAAGLPGETTPTVFITCRRSGARAFPWHRVPWSYGVPVTCPTGRRTTVIHGHSRTPSNLT